MSPETARHISLDSIVDAGYNLLPRVERVIAVLEKHYNTRETDGLPSAVEQSKIADVKSGAFKLLAASNYTGLTSHLDDELGIRAWVEENEEFF
ncbi:MAG: hypothetical protein H6765_07320 [Candidatus Peribacteria bacterium]|nr:MAG: hypothetical protein H6765_07320 [Candidatus Peribacteria bacterium]